MIMSKSICHKCGEFYNVPSLCNHCEAELKSALAAAEKERDDLRERIAALEDECIEHTGEALRYEKLYSDLRAGIERAKGKIDGEPRHTIIGRRDAIKIIENETGITKG